MGYLKTVLDKYHLNRETGKCYCLLVFNYHLNGKIMEGYKDKFKEDSNAHPW